MCAEFLRRLTDAEQQHGIPFDKDVDAFLRACLAEGRDGSPLTHFYLRLLGLEARPTRAWGPGRFFLGFRIWGAGQVGADSGASQPRCG